MSMMRLQSLVLNDHLVKDPICSLQGKVSFTLLYPTHQRVNLSLCPHLCLLFQVSQQYRYQNVAILLTTCI